MELDALTTLLPVEVPLKKKKKKKKKTRVDAPPRSLLLNRVNALTTATFTRENTNYEWLDPQSRYVGSLNGSSYTKTKVKTLFRPQSSKQ